MSQAKQSLTKNEAIAWIPPKGQNASTFAFLVKSKTLIEKITIRANTAT
jgi:hypothetical protein